MEEKLNKNINSKKLNDDTLNNISAGYRANSIDVSYSRKRKCYYTMQWDENKRKNVFVKIPLELGRELVDVTHKMVKIVGDPNCSSCVNWDLAGKYEEATGKDITYTIENFS